MRDFNLEELIRQAYHSLAIYSVVAGMPNYLKIPDIVDSAMSKNKKQLVNDLEYLMIRCVSDLCDLLVDKITDKAFKNEIKSKLAKQKKKSASIKSKNTLIRILNSILENLNIKFDIKPLPENV